MAPAKLWLRIFFSGFAVIVALLVITLATPVPYGDLSRIGLFSDAAFGWRVPPPRVAPQDLRAAPVDEADIVVIGDSFSMTYRWQSVLVKAGYRVTTAYWGQFDERLCDDFDAWLERAGFKGKLVVIESVERLLHGRLEGTQECARMKHPFVARTEPFASPLEHVPGFALNWSGKLTSGWTTYQNTRQARERTGDGEASFLTRARAVPDGCALFSHPLCSKALFYQEDDDNGELAEGDLAQMRAFTKAHPAPPILWMVIPNKTTVYVEPGHSRAFFGALRQAGLGPDLYGFAMQQKTRIRDFYFPNDTHLSMQGQLALGEFMLEEVRKILPAPAPRSS